MSQTSSFNNIISRKFEERVYNPKAQPKTSFFSKLGSKLGRELSRTVRGNIIQKPKESINNMLRKNKKNMLNGQKFYYDKIRTQDLFSRMNTKLYCNEADAIEIVPRIDFNKVVNVLNLRFTIPRSYLLSENIVDVSFNYIGEGRTEQIKSVIKINDLLKLLNETLKNNLYENDELLKKLELLTNNFIYLKEQKHIDDFTKSKLSQYINIFVLNVFGNFQNNINYIRFLINEYCQTFGIYLEDYNYLKLSQKLIKNYKGQERNITFVEERVLPNQTIVENENRTGLLSGIERIGEQIGFTITDTTHTPLNSVNVQEETWNKIRLNLNNYFDYPIVLETFEQGEKIKMTKNNILEFGINLVKILFYNVYAGSEFLNKLENLLISENTTLKKSKGINSLNKLLPFSRNQVKIIYYQIINEEYIPIRKLTSNSIINVQFIQQSFDIINTNLEQLIQVFSIENYDFFSNYRQLKNLLSEVVKNFNKIDEFKKSFELKEEQLQNYNNSLIQLCGFYNLLSEKINEIIPYYLGFTDETANTYKESVSLNIEVLINLFNLHIFKRIYQNRNICEISKEELEQYQKSTLVNIFKFLYNKNLIESSLTSFLQKIFGSNSRNRINNNNIFRLLLNYCITCFTSANRTQNINSISKCITENNKLFIKYFNLLFENQDIITKQTEFEAYKLLLEYVSTFIQSIVFNFYERLNILNNQKTTINLTNFEKFAKIINNLVKLLESLKDFNSEFLLKNKQNNFQNIDSIIHNIILDRQNMYQYFITNRFTNKIMSILIELQ